MARKATNLEEEKKREELLKRMAEKPDWSDEELEEMGPGLRGYILEGLKVRAQARQYLGKRDKPVSKCARCKKEFRVEGTGQMYCSEECGYAFRQREYRRRKRRKKWA